MLFHQRILLIILSLAIINELKLFYYELILTILNYFYHNVFLPILL